MIAMDVTHSLLQKLFEVMIHHSLFVQAKEIKGAQV